MLAVNQVLQNRYRIIRQLGAGGMGAVYEAEDNQRFGKKVALKEVLLNLTEKNSEHFRRAFEREAKILTQIDHEAVPKVIGYILETDFQILVMELIKGEDLDEILEREKKPFALKEVVGWTEQLLDALDYLHTLEQPIIHRDIKPQNLKLTKRGKIKLLDFGIAKDSEVELNTTKSAHKTMIGATRSYSPIEQIIRIPDFFETFNSIYPEKAQKVLSQSADARSDIYALGATLYNLLTNHYPKPADLRALEVWAGRADSLTSLQKLNPQISPEIAEVLHKAMAIERDDRFASAHEMQTALQDAVSHETRRKEAEARFNLLQEQEKIRREREELEAEKRKLAEERQSRQNQDAEAERKRREQLEAERKQQQKEKSSGNDSSEEKLALTEPWDGKSTEESYVRNSKSNIKTIKSINLRPAPIPAPPKPNNSSWVFPFFIVSLVILIVAVIGAAFIFNKSGIGISNKTNSNSGLFSPTPTSSQTLQPTISPTTSPAISPTQTTKPTTIPKKQNDKQPVIQPKRETMEPIDSPTDEIQRKPTNKPKPQPTKSSDCIFTGDC